MNNNSRNNSRIYPTTIQRIILVVLMFSVATIISGCLSGENTNKIVKTIIKPMNYCCSGTGCIRIIQQSSNLSSNYPDIKVCDIVKFSENCFNKNGNIVVNQLNSENTINECYPIASDMNKTCSSDNDCIYYCDLESSIKKHNCNDISQLKKDEVDSNGNNLYTTTYLCNKPKTPGVCSISPKGIVYNQEVTTIYYMDGNHLIKDERLNK